MQNELKAQGRRVGRTKLAEILKELGYLLQSNGKTKEDEDHPDRNKQFKHIAKRVKAYRHRRRSAISVDTKKKEVLSNKAENTVRKVSR